MSELLEEIERQQRNCYAKSASLNPRFELRMRQKAFEKLCEIYRKQSLDWVGQVPMTYMGMPIVVDNSLLFEVMVVETL